MKVLKSLISIFLMTATVSTVAMTDKNIAYQDNQVRFTVITDGVIRLEWEPSGRFTDSPSFVASERNYPDAEFTVSTKGKTVKITTGKMELTYRKESGKFTEDNLKIKSTDGMFEWKPGMKQKANLKGTFRTLDGMDGNTLAHAWVTDAKQGEIRELEDGILSRDGWTLIDESENYLLDDSEWAWVKERETEECQDWYFMAYGHDYKAALKDFTVFAGRMPLPPRFTFGYWWSRYWCYSDRELRTLVKKLKSYDIPLDVLVVDMDWHYTDPGRGDWTGWTWNKSIFPNHKEFLKYMKDEGLKVTLNLHPADGFEPYEWCYPALSERLGRSTDGQERIEWINSDKDFMSAMFEEVMHPMQAEGVDFWWLDWQQHVYDKRMGRLNNTWWINHCYFTDMERHGDKRPLLYHRWGGLGNHRYQIGFSGDAVISWKSLEFQPYFTATASNVLYGYWSHDIGGHLGDNIDPEMYIRWLQFGGVSPIMRTHSTKNSGLNKEPWVFTEEHTDIIRRTIRQRYTMVPYIYTMARKGYEDGISLCRPLYYDYPEHEEAYEFRNEYMFGDNMLIAPITEPAVNGFTEADIWLPDGRWYELHTGTLLDGGRTVKRLFALDEYGIYIKAGSVLPFYSEDVNNLNGNDEDIIVTVFPAGDGQFTIYEDAGNDKNYKTEFAETRISNTWNGSVQTIRISPRKGSYEDMPADRNFKVKIVASQAPESVTVNGREAGYEYLERDLAFIIDIPTKDCGTEKIVEIRYNCGSPALADGLIGLSGRMARTIDAFKYRIGVTPIDELSIMGTINEAIMYSPEKAEELSEQFLENYRRLPEILSRQPHLENDIEWFLQHCGWRP